VAIAKKVADFSPFLPLFLDLLLNNEIHIDISSNYYLFNSYRQFSWNIALFIVNDLSVHIII